MGKNVNNGRYGGVRLLDMLRRGKVEGYDRREELAPHATDVEVRICALRGRGDVADGDVRAPGWVQRLEVGGEVANALTSVWKDNLVMEVIDRIETIETIETIEIIENGYEQADCFQGDV